MARPVVAEMLKLSSGNTEYVTRPLSPLSLSSALTVSTLTPAVVSSATDTCRTQIRPFWRQSSQPTSWLVLKKQNPTETKLNTKYKNVIQKTTNLG